MRPRILVPIFLAIVVVTVGLHVAVTDVSSRVHVLRVVLALMATGEGAAAVSQIFRARRFSEGNGRPYDPAHHGVLQDFGFYNLALAALFALVALDPPRYPLVIGVALGLYAIHGATHLLRYLGLRYGGEPATRAREFELRDALPLVAAAIGLALFFPWSLRAHRESGVKAHRRSAETEASGCIRYPAGRGERMHSAGRRAA